MKLFDRPLGFQSVFVCDYDADDVDDAFSLSSTSSLVVSYQNHWIQMRKSHPLVWLVAWNSVVLFLSGFAMCAAVSNMKLMYVYRASDNLRITITYLIFDRFRTGRYLYYKFDILLVLKDI